MTYDVAIVGGGVIGAAVAYELASNGVRTVIFDDPAALGKATTAATGLLLGGAPGALSTEKCVGARASLAMYAAWVAGLEKRTGLQVGYKPGAVLRLALDTRDESRLRRLAEEESSCCGETHWLPRSKLLEEEPWLEPRAQGALWVSLEGTVDPRALLTALWQASSLAGALLLQTRVTRFYRSGRGWQIEGQETHVRASELVLAAGHWTRELAAGLGVTVPLYPVRGTAFAVQGGFRLRQALLARNLHLVPRPGGNIVVGSTVEPRLADPQIKPEALAKLRARSESVFPALQRVPIRAVWTGIRPGSTVRRPIVARVPREPGLVVASGHHRSGLTLAPLTAGLVREILCGEANSDLSRLFAWPTSSQAPAS